MIKTEIKKLEKSEMEITSSILSSDFEKYEEKALNRLIQDIELPGFRKGHVPKDQAKKSLNDLLILEEMAGLAINEAYPKILEENKIDAIGSPSISITKIARGNDLEFKIVTAVLPEIKLPDYKKIAKDENKKEEHKKEIIISEEDLNKTIDELRKSRASSDAKAMADKHQEMHNNGVEHDHKEEPMDKELELPALDDEFVKSLGKFENVEDFKNKLQENMKMEKDLQKKDKCRLLIIEEILKQTQAEIPEVLIDSEANKLIYRMEADIANMGMKFEDYLKQINKTKEDLKKDWRGEAEKRAKLEMIIFKISENEKIKPSEEEVAKEVENITKMYKDADPLRAKMYIEQMLTNEKVFTFLDEQ